MSQTARVCHKKSSGTLKRCWNLLCEIFISRALILQKSWRPEEWCGCTPSRNLSLFHRSGVCYKERKKGDRIKLRRMPRKIGVHAFQILTGYHRFLGEENMHRALWITLFLNLLLWIRFVKGPNTLTQNFHVNYGSCTSILINCLNTNMSLLSRWNNMNINDKLPAYWK